MTQPRPDTIQSQPDDNTTVTEVLASYAEAGYNDQFSVDDDARVLCHTCRQRIDPANLDGISLRRLEGASDPSDMLAVVALSCPRCGARGTLLLNYGPEAGAEHGQVLRALNDRRGQGALADAQTPGEADASSTSTTPTSASTTHTA